MIAPIGHATSATAGRLNEGWTWLLNSRKDHYFRDGKSLCRRYLLLSDNALEDRPGTGFHDCATCARILNAESRTP